MPANKDKKTSKWMCQFYYTDWTGERKKKCKRGFETKHEALEWEREFLRSRQADVTMTFASFVDIYFEDMKPRLRQSTLESKHWVVDLKITPFFGRMCLSDIKASDVRRWQNQLLAYRDNNGKPYSQTYLKTINNQLTAILNFAMKYYDLKENPCHKAGTMGKSNAEEMEFWTKDEFAAFIPHVKCKPQSYAAFMTLYYTGMRIGEAYVKLKLKICEKYFSTYNPKPHPMMSKVRFSF
jgi:integrase